MSDEKTKDLLTRQGIAEIAKKEFERPLFQPVFSVTEELNTKEFPSPKITATIDPSSIDDQIVATCAKRDNDYSLDKMREAVTRLRTERIRNFYEAQLCGTIITLDETLPDNACVWHVGKQIWDELQEFKQKQG